MVRKTILFFIIIALAVSGFAQKSKRKSFSKAPKNTYFVMLINGEETPAERYCPGDTILFDLDTTKVKILSYCWDIAFFVTICDSTPIKFIIPTGPEYIPFDHTATLDFTFTINSDTIRDTLTHIIHVDYIRTILDTTVCQGRNITVPTLKGDITFENVQGDQDTPWDRYDGSKCDSLVRWHIEMKPYIEDIRQISSCDSVVWGFNDPNSNTLPKQIIVRRPPNYEGDYTDSIQRIFFATDPNSCCDTLKTLKVTIVETGNLKIKFDQNAFCSGEDMNGIIELGTNFTAFDWTYFGKDTTITEVKSITIEEPGNYHVYGYMDTSLYEIYTDLRIVATACALRADTTVADCPLVFPNVFTPNGDNVNDIFGIRKLNTKRENELTIHDRWGKEVFRQKNYKCLYKGDGYHNTENAFDGNSRGGQKLPEGTYYYAFKYDAITVPKSKAKTYVGVVVIVR